MGITETLTKQVGPLPVGAWIAVVGGGLGLAWYTNRNKSSSPDMASTGTDPGVGVGGATPGFLPSPAPTPATPDGYADNDAWANAAVRYLVANNNNPTASSIAIRKYVDGSSWTAAEDVLIKVALKALGPPPMIPIGGGAIPAPTTPIPPTPTSTAPGIWIVAQAGNPTTTNLQKMAKRFLGYYAGFGVIFNANRQGVRRPDGSMGVIPLSMTVPIGARIWIPGGVYRPPGNY